MVSFCGYARLLVERGLVFLPHEELGTGITEECMSKQCAFCGKRPQVGNYVSHSNIKTKRRFSPNLQRVRHQFDDGTVSTITVCTRCLRSGVVKKPVKNAK